MKDLLYISHPAINEINANIKKRKYDGSFTKLILDKSIFMPNCSYLLDENPKISSFDVIDVSLIDGNLIHTIKGKPEKSSLLLQLDKNKRNKNIQYNTAFYLFKAIFYKFYNTLDLKLIIENSKAKVKISNFYEDINQDDLLFLINRVIKLGLDVNKNIESVFIDGFESFENNGVYLNNTKYLEGIYINSIEKLENSLIIDFVAGDDYLKFVDDNINLVNEIKNIVLDDINSNDKIRKIISSIQKLNL